MNNALFTISQNLDHAAIEKTKGDQPLDMDRQSEFVDTKSFNFRTQIKEKQRLAVPLSKFSREERSFMARRNHKMLQATRQKNDLNKT